MSDSSPFSVSFSVLFKLFEIVRYEIDAGRSENFCKKANKIIMYIVYLVKRFGRKI